MTRRLAILLLMLAAPMLPGQVADRTAGKDEFPALQLLPPGSKVHGISLPRYQDHRVTAHIIADLLEICTRQLVKMDAIRTALYGENNEITYVELEAADYNFGTSVMISDRPASVNNPRFSARGAAATFNTATQQGIMKGPVYTTLNTNVIAQPPAPPKK